MRVDINQIISSSKDIVNLGKLNILNNEIEEIAAFIVKTKPDVKEIFLNDNLLGDESGQILAMYFQMLTHLTTLDLQSNNFDHEGAKAIYSLFKNNPKLNILFYDNNINDVDEIDNIKKSYLHETR